MGSSSPAPPGDGQSPDGEDDELELTSIMDAEQRRALQQAARAKAEEAKEPERPTARPPPEAAAMVQEEVAIPKSQRVPGELAGQAASPASAEKTQAAKAAAPSKETPAKAASAPTPAKVGGGASPLALVSFVLLAAAVAYELTR